MQAEGLVGKGFHDGPKGVDKFVLLCLAQVATVHQGAVLVEVEGHGRA